MAQCLKGDFQILYPSSDVPFLIVPFMLLVYINLSGI